MDNIDLQDQEEAEEALSLCDFPIRADHREEPSKCLDRRSSSEPTEFFEFFNDLSSEMSHAEDIIFSGKLVPFKEQPISRQTHKSGSGDERLKSFHRRRSESLPALKTTSQSNSPRSRVARNSRSFDYQNLRRNLSTISETSEIYRNSAVRSSGKSDNKMSKPRWYLLMFGLVKFPPEMELKDMKNRQVRQTPATMFPPLYVGGKLPVNQTHRKSAWGLLRVLSCKDHASVAVTSSFGCIPQV